jgi:hypothetical protein
MAATTTLNITFLSGNLVGQTADVSITEAENLVATGFARLTTPGVPAADPDAVFTPGPTLDK